GTDVILREQEFKNSGIRSCRMSARIARGTYGSGAALPTPKEFCVIGDRFNPTLFIYTSKPFARNLLTPDS
ncbi:MAG TPA: hypothetical protein VGH07_01250, partial [Chthoniobacterales bacterium]